MSSVGVTIIPKQEGLSETVGERRGERATWTLEAQEGGELRKPESEHVHQSQAEEEAKSRKGELSRALFLSRLPERTQESGLWEEEPSWKGQNKAGTSPRILPSHPN